LRRVASTEKCSCDSSRLTFGSDEKARQTSHPTWKARRSRSPPRVSVAKDAPSAPAPRYHDKRPLAVWGPLQRRKKAQDTREPYLATNGGHDERMSSVSSIAGAPVNVVLPRGKDDDQNWPPKAPIEGITPSSRVYQHHRPEAVLHPSTSGSGERRGNRLMLPQSV